MSTPKKTLAVFAAGALFTPLVSLGSPAFAAGEDTPPAPRAIADLCANVPADYDPFVDDNGNTFEQNIECLAFAEITQGQSGGNTYGPGGVVRRDQMASFIARLIDKADELDTGDNIQTLPAYDGTVDFTDVPANNVHRQAIDRLSEANIVSGGPGGRPSSQYGPELEVTRAQMASFIRNALAFMTGVDITSDKDFFSDDENATPHEPRINAVAELGIAVGDGNSTYNPFASVTRGQMAGFLTRTLAVLEQDGDIRPVGEDEPAPEPEPGTPEVTVENSNVAAGDDIAFTIESDDITSVTVTGACIETETFTEDSDAEAAGFQVVVPVREDAQEGTCQIDVDFTDAEGNEFTSTFDVTVTAAPAATETVTERPELVSVEFVATRQETGTPLPGDEAMVTDVRFTFDEPVTGEEAPSAALFHLVGFDSSNRYDGVEATVEEDENSVLVTFGETPNVGNPGGENVGEAELAEISLATVDFGAVTDVEGNENPIGDSPFGEGRTDTTGQAGITSAPDLVSVGEFTSPAGQNTTRVTFTFDQDAFTVQNAGFHLVTTDNQLVNCTAVDGADGGRTAESDETIVANCEEQTVGSDITAANIARGYVDAGTVSSASQTATPGTEGDVNPLQATQTPDADSTGPDLVSATFDVETDEVTYTFDAPVRIANDTDTDAGGADTDTDGPDGAGDFRVYTADGGPGTAGTAARRSSTSSSEVIVTFAEGTLADAVGASAGDSAVEAATTAAMGTNRADEVGVANEQSTQFTPGVTDGPDLVGVEIGTGTSATFTFDEEIARDTGTNAAGGNVVEEGFSLYLADGTRLECTSSTSTTDTPNSVTCTAFSVDVANGGAATSAQVRDAVLGTVDNGAVRDTEDTPNTNPEGAEITTGGTGTPSA